MVPVNFIGCQFGHWNFELLYAEPGQTELPKQNGELSRNRILLHIGQSSYFHNLARVWTESAHHFGICIPVLCAARCWNNIQALDRQYRLPSMGPCDHNCGRDSHNLPIHIGLKLPTVPTTHIFPGNLSFTSIPPPYNTNHDLLLSRRRRPRIQQRQIWKSISRSKKQHRVQRVRVPVTLPA